MKTFKKRIQEEMVSTDEDKLIFEILRENSNLAKYETTGRKAYRRLIKEKCDECERIHCPHKYEPLFTKDWGFRCFIIKVKAI